LPLLVLPVALAATNSEAAATHPCPLTFVDRAAAAGIDFVHDAGARGEKHLPETMGSGAAWLDYDGDGWLDLYLVQSGPFPPDGSPPAANRLYRNLGPQLGGALVSVVPRFEDVTARAGDAGDRGYGQGVLAADFDGDGHVDLWVGNYGPDVILWNDGHGGFERQLLAAVGSDERGYNWSSSAAAADADGDGDIDLYVARYLEYDAAHGLFCGELGETAEGERREYCDPSLFLGQPDRFYWNRGERRFEEGASAAGIVDTEGKGLGVVFTDLDGDGAPDIYVANDVTLNSTFRNRLRDTSSASPSLPSPLFEDATLFSGAAVNRAGKPEAGMGVIAADFDRDGDPDLAVTNFDVETNTLYENQGGLFFEDVSARSGFGPPSFNLLGFGLVAVDFDLDGALDTYVANGHIFEQPRRENTTYRQRDLLLRGDGRGAFTTTPCAVSSQPPAVARGAAAADFDLDGDVDLVVTHIGASPFLLQNTVRSRHGATDTGARPPPAFVAVELLGQPTNTQAIGAVVTLEQGRVHQRRWVQAGDSYQSSSERRQVFGLVSASPDGALPVLDVTWPSGRRQRVVVPRLDTHLRLVEEASP
jgi:enediyne biosynthesis protein E4